LAFANLSILFVVKRSQRSLVTRHRLSCKKEIYITHSERELGTPVRGDKPYILVIVQSAITIHGFLRHATLLLNTWAIVRSLQNFQTWQFASLSLRKQQCNGIKMPLNPSKSFLALKKLTLYHIGKTQSSFSSADTKTKCFFHFHQKFGH